MFSVYPFLLWWLREYIYIYTLSYYHHQIGSMNYYPLFRVRSWNNGVRCMSFYILIVSPSSTKKGQWDSEYAVKQLEGIRWRQSFQCVTHNNSVVETSHTRDWDHLEPSTQWATSRNHTLYWACDYFSMLGFKIIHVSKRAPDTLITVFAWQNDKQF